MEAAEVSIHRRVKAHGNRLRRLISIHGSKTLAPPSLMIVHPTHRCNLDCYMCFSQPNIREGGGNRGEELGIQQWMELVSAASEWGVERVWVVGGGEPLMKEGIRDLLRHVKAKRMMGLLSTNGVLFDEEYARLLVEIGWDQVIFSIDAATPHAYRKIRRRDCFDTVRRNIRALADIREGRGRRVPEIILYVVVLPENYKDLDRMIVLGREVGADKVIFGNAFPENPASTLTERQEEEAKQTYIRASKLAVKLGVRTNIGLFHRKREYLQNLMCTKPWTQIGIRFDGKVEPCALSKEVLGDVNEKSLQSVWESPEYAEFRRKRRNGEFADYCDNCDIFDQHMFRFSRDFLTRPAELLEFLRRGSFV
jgi:radical SAM protein with 4Fe4S-binding SPASM domain